MPAFAFEKLRVWQQTRELNKNIYKLTRDFPDAEKYGLQGQIRRASISVLLNIAEGSGKKYQKDQARYYSNAYGSLMEVMASLILSQDLEYLSEDVVIEMRPQIADIAHKINLLSRSTDL